MNNKIVFVSSNHIFGGSEKLWVEAALCFSTSFEVVVFVNYKHSFLERLNISNIQVIYSNEVKKVKNKLKSFVLRNDAEDLKLYLLKHKPLLVVYSKGAPFSSLKDLEMLVSINQKFVTINQLISEYHWLNISNANYNRFKLAYNRSEKNFFVSKNNLDLFTQMIGELENTDLISNPGDTKKSGFILYPKVEENFKIAFVGRFEFYHKGIDLLLSALESPIWKSRNIEVNFYGEGPHKLILQEWIRSKNLFFCKIQDFKDDISEIWKVNHILALTSRFEGKSLSISEASFYGRPTIATNVGGAMEQIENGKTGFLIDYLTIESINSVLETAWMSRFQWEQMGVAAREKFLNDNPLDPVSLFVTKVCEII
jgi:glycosyltransferase involved in cell wall biosynthesis